MIYKKTWNFFGAILDDLPKTWKFILDDSQWFSTFLSDLQKTEIYLSWFLMILGDLWKLWNLFGVIFDDSQWFVKNWNLFGAILDDFWQFLVISENSEIYLG